MFIFFLFTGGVGVGGVVGGAEGGGGGGGLEYPKPPPLGTPLIPVDVTSINTPTPPVK